MPRPKRAPTKEIKCSADLVDWMGDLAMLYGLPVRDVIDAIVGDFYEQAKDDKRVKDRVLKRHIELTDARPSFCYLDERGIARVKANRDRQLKKAGIETPKGQALPDWLQ